MESIKGIVTVGQKVIAHKGTCIGIKIYESNKELTVTKVNKKFFIHSAEDANRENYFPCNVID